MDMSGDLETVFEGIWPGHRMMQGTRTPPSKTEPLPSRRPPLEPAWLP